MSRNKSIVIIASICLITILACNLSGPSVVSGTNPDTAAATAALQTQVALLVASTSAAQTALAQALAETQTAVVQSLAETQTAIATNTPEFTFTPSLTITPTFTLTPTTPMVSVSVNTNCRNGPGDPYDLVGSLQVGQNAEVVGQVSGGGYWIVRLPGNPAAPCWLWSKYATVTGNWQVLPVVTPPPTPTPAANFDVSYVGMVTCGGEYGFTFKISNPGSNTWESIKIVVKDTVTATVETHTRDAFKRYTGCTASGEDLNLEPGETGYATSVDPGQFTYNPAGHAMKATITVCSKDALAGTCLSKVVSYTP